MDETTADLYDRGTILFEQGNYEEAEKLFIELVSKNSGFADIHNKIGYIRHQMGDYGKASEHYRNAVNLNPSYTEASMNLAVALTEMGAYDEAEAALKTAAATSRCQHPDLDSFTAKKLANEHFRLGKKYMDLNMHPEAVREFEKAEKLAPDLVDVMVNHGTALRSMGRMDDAVNMLRKAKKARPEYGPAWVQLAVTYYSKGLKAEALESLEDCLRVMPDLKQAQIYLDLLRGRV